MMGTKRRDNFCPEFSKEEKFLSNFLLTLLSKEFREFKSLGFSFFLFRYDMTLNE